MFDVGDEVFFGEDRTAKGIIKSLSSLDHDLYTVQWDDMINSYEYYSMDLTLVSESEELYEDEIL